MDAVPYPSHDLVMNLVGDSSTKTYIDFKIELKDLMRKHHITYVQAIWVLRDWPE